MTFDDGSLRRTEAYDLGPTYTMVLHISEKDQNEGLERTSARRGKESIMASGEEFCKSARVPLP